MERRLTDFELNNIKAISQSAIEIIIKYGNIAKIIAPIFTIAFFIYLSYEISLGSFWGYIAIGIIFSILEIAEVTKLQKPYNAIINDECTCMETKLLSKERKSIRGSQINYRYYATVCIEQENKKVEYKGNEYEYINVGEEMIVIKLKVGTKKYDYICFSKKEIHRM